MFAKPMIPTPSETPVRGDKLSPKAKRRKGS